MSAGHWKRLATSWVLLAAALLLAGGLLALIGSTVLPQAGVFVYAAAGLMLFLLVQLLVFRLIGLRSRADELHEAAEAPHEMRDALRERPAGGAGEPASAHEASGAAPGEHVPPHQEAGETDARAEEQAEHARDWRAWRG
ncbi:MAG TPA: hypothetical protein VK824_08570 [Planctomycetota bacterium]|nr:hypothetical protein [Planctomycetota bacterium]